MTTIAIVSGPGEGFSEMSAVCLADQGIDVAILARDGTPVADQVRARGRRALAVTDGHITGAVQRVCAELGHPTVLVNHVVAGPAAMSSMSIADWDSRVGGQLRSIFLASRAVIDPMVLQGSGRIVTVVDGYAGENSTVRAAVEGFTRTIAAELQPFAITANVIVAQVQDRPNLTGTLSFLVNAAGVTGQIIRAGT